MAQTEHSPQSTRCVALIDDNDGLRRMLALALDTAGFDVFAASTQLELQRWLARARPDALIINLQRAEADGLNVLRRMRSRASLEDVPILFLSNSDADDFRYEVIAAGADWFGLRPFGMIELQNRVSRLIRSGRPKDTRELSRAGAARRSLQRTG
jgi:DNA-binding response OmpR family regulator